METDKIVLDLNRRFAVPLPEFYERRIIFWHDEEKEYADKLDEIRLENAKLVALTGSNTFAVKKMLSVDDLTSNYVVYCPISYERQEDDWLLDIELYSESYRTDAVSNWMQELDILDNPSMRKLVKHYRKFFGAQARRAKIMAQDKIPATPAQLHMAVMAALCGMKKAQPNEILLSVLRGGLDKAQNPIYQSFVDYSAEEAFWAMVRQGCGYAEEEPDLGQLAIHLLIVRLRRAAPLPLPGRQLPQPGHGFLPELLRAAVGADLDLGHMVLQRLVFVRLYLQLGAALLQLLIPGLRIRQLPAQTAAGLLVVPHLQQLRLCHPLGILQRLVLLPEGLVLRLQRRHTLLVFPAGLLNVCNHIAAVKAAEHTGLKAGAHP